jgi:hypothetical protein
MRWLISAAGGSYAPVRDEAERHYRWKSELPISACSVRIADRAEGSGVADGAQAFVVRAPSACHECTAPSATDCRKWVDVLAGLHN